MAVKIPITLRFAKGAYTVPVYISATDSICNLLLDTGSSLIVLRRKVTQLKRTFELTRFVRLAEYGVGGWVGRLIKTNINLGGVEMAAQPVALMEYEKETFLFDADGLLGMAFSEMSFVYQNEFLSALLQKSACSDSTDTRSFFNETKKILQCGSKKFLKPFSQDFLLNNNQADRFSIITARSIYTPKDTLQADNEGFLIVGDESECCEPYYGRGGSVSLVSDKYYNVHLLRVWVDDCEEFHAPELKEHYVERYKSNAIIDTGCSFVIFEQSVFAYVIESISRISDRHRDVLVAALAAQRQLCGVTSAMLNNLRWPDLNLVLQGENNEGESCEIVLQVSATNYWQSHAPEEHQTMFMLAPELTGWGNQTILGLPLMNDYLCTFDRQWGKNGVVRFANVAPEWANRQSKSRLT